MILFFYQKGKDMLRNVLHKFLSYGGLALGMSGAMSAGYVTLLYLQIMIYFIDETYFFNE